ncbi:hypothetical protein [Streptomyces sp. NPDC096153]|uniref:hypothetical protein n=1 Tax=Streptomyces sp. NPDC096153 TaxID=3155548 RepID=UPI003327A056
MPEPDSPQAGAQRLDPAMVAAALGHMARAQEALRQGLAAFEAALNTPLPAPDDGICTATIRAHWSGETIRCAQRAGHYDETRRPVYDEDTDDPGGWHWRPNGDDGVGRYVWADQAEDATPHTPTAGGSDA